MEILSLIIKQKYFDAILQGRKVQEFREIRPTTEKKFCEMDSDGYCKYVDGEFIPRHYDAIKFYVGYEKDRDWALVKVNGAKIELLTDEQNEPIRYEYKGEECLASQVVYDLGEIIERNVKF